MLFRSLYPVALGAYRVLTTTPEQVQRFIATSQAWEATNNAAYGSGSFLAAVREHTREMVYYYANLRPLLRTLAGYAQLFATMLIGLWLAAITAVAGSSGAYLGGGLTDRLRARDPRYFAWVPAIAGALGVPFVAFLLFRREPHQALLLSVPFVLFIDVLELLVAVIQAFIFTMLTALFIGLAVHPAH